MHQLLSDSDNMTVVVLKITIVTYDAKMLNAHPKPKLIGHTLIARRLTEKQFTHKYYKYIYIYTHI